MSTNSHSFLGSGWSFPPTFYRESAQVEMVSDQADIEQSLYLLLSTRPGERTLNPDFGCDLTQFLFEEVSHGLLTEMQNIIADAILFHEPRIEVEAIDIVESETETGLLLIHIDCIIPATNSRFNLVHLFYLQEAYFPA